MSVAEQHQSSVANMRLRALREQERAIERYVESHLHDPAHLFQEVCKLAVHRTEVDVAEMRLTEGRTEKLAETLMEEVLKEIRCCA